MTATATAADEQLVAALHERGQRVTSQRILIHRTLRELNRHVTAEEVLEAVSDRLPNLSAPTVYSSLELFEELGLVRRLGVAHGAALFDPRPEPHDHMVCRRCGRIEDLDGGVGLAAAVESARRRGFSPERVEARVTGLCPECAQSGSSRGTISS